MSIGSLSDHVYVKQTTLDTTEHAVLNVYYSDHDAVKISIYRP